MTEKYSSATFGSGELPEMRFGVRVTPADEHELADALATVDQNEAEALVDADQIIG